MGRNCPMDEENTIIVYKNKEDTNLQFNMEWMSHTMNIEKCILSKDDE